MIEELKPCPFCGSEARTYVGKRGIEVRCANPDCGIRTPALTDIRILEEFVWDDEEETSLEECIRIWNRRLDNGKTENTL